MASFSWSDSFQAVFAPCLACLHGRSPQLPDSDDESQHEHAHNHGASAVGRITRARPDELEGLLADSDDAETLSLHSNFGDRDHDRRRTKKNKNKNKNQKLGRGMRVFGFDLFGRPPIHLTDDEDEEESSALASNSNRRESGRGRGRGGSVSQSRPRANDDRSRTISTDTLDSDAAPLDPATIDELSAAQLTESLRKDEEERRLKEERRKLRRERKELKKAAMHLAMAQAEANGDGNFEGFPGSGAAYGHIPSPFRQYATDGSGMSSPQPYDEFGPFEQGQHFPSHAFEQPPISRQESDEADVDGADFGAENYARRTPSGNSGGTGSDSRSRTSASISNTDSTRYNNHHHYLSHQPIPQQPPFSPLSQDQFDPEHTVDSVPTPKRKEPRKSARHSISTASQSTGPVSPPPQVQAFAPQPMIVTPENYPNQHPGVLPPGIDDQKVPAAGFPSVGLTGGMRRKNSEAGVFLARRGDD